jgi:hypothetical protein
MDVALNITERYFKLDGVIFRVRLDGLDRGAQYLRHGTWVWTPITSASVLHDPHASELSWSDAEELRPSG